MSMARVFAVVALCAAFCWAGAGRAAEVTLLKVDGTEAHGALESFDATKGAVVAGQAVPLADIVFMKLAPLPAQGSKERLKVVLVNNDALYGTIVSGTDRALKLRTASLGELELKNDALKVLLFPKAASASDAVLNGFLTDKNLANNDAILVVAGDKVDAIPGFVNEFTDKEVSFKVEDQARPFAFDQITALRIAQIHDPKPPEGIQTNFRLKDGSEISGTTAGLGGAGFQLVIADGQTLNVPFTEVTQVDIKGGRLAFLSDLEPSAVEQKPFVGGAAFIFNWRKDGSVSGPNERLRAGRKEYSKGLGVHSFTKLTYDLGGIYATLVGDAVMDTTAGLKSQVTWQVMGDGKELAKGDSTAGNPPQAFKLDVTGVKSLELICDFGPDGDDVGDSFIWGEMRLIKP